ncbi:type III secretion system protein [Paraburkholderia sp. NMBU_R16]|uniref:type III secretion system protein n=1 Tax=Paraburkholderia sp. NMBU_R16 TaxID=2698676 RepID=UPI001567262E|nr:type III secretion system protein [Paraburkholderia sp. NMBU_R16]NRO98985.1 type III secretion system protein [Paraburkholderia sp. NMBU_R16]
MKDRRVLALQRVLSRRERLGRKLETALASLRAESAELDTDLKQRQAAVEAQIAETKRQDGKIDAMIGGKSFRADQFLMLREHRTVLSDRKAMLQAEADRSAAALDAKLADVRKQSAQILQNRARIDVYDSRRKTLISAIETAIEDAQDEESSENRRPNTGPGF